MPIVIYQKTFDPEQNIYLAKEVGELPDFESKNLEQMLAAKRAYEHCENEEKKAHHKRIFDLYATYLTRHCMYLNLKIDESNYKFLEIKSENLPKIFKSPVQNTQDTKKTTKLTLPSIGKTPTPKHS